MIQPKSPPDSNSIDEVIIYCDYHKLPKNYKEAISLNSLYSIILDTEEREKAFYNSLNKSKLNMDNMY